MSAWHTGDTDLPDFRVHGFHTGRLLEFRLSDGRVITDVYQGYGIFGRGRGYDWMAGEPHVTAWRAPDSSSGSQS